LPEVSAKLLPGASQVLPSEALTKVGERA
jgi:hypothetical protein